MIDRVRNFVRAIFSMLGTACLVVMALSSVRQIDIAKDSNEKLGRIDAWVCQNNKLDGTQRDLGMRFLRQIAEIEKQKQQ